MYESMNQQQIESMKELNDQIFYLQEQNTRLEKSIYVELKAELNKVKKEKDMVEDRNRELVQ